MGILFVISIVALLALLWAAFSMAQHIRRARRRRRNALEAVAATKAQMKEIANSESLAPAKGNDRQSDDRRPEVTGEEIPNSTVTVPRDWSHVRYSTSGIVGNTFTGRSPKI